MGHREVIVRSLGVVRQVTSRRLRGSQAISREPPIMRDLGNLKELLPRSTSEALSVLGAIGGSGWDVLGVDQKSNLRLPVDERRWGFLTGY